MDVSYR